MAEMSKASLLFNSRLFLGADHFGLFSIEAAWASPVQTLLKDKIPCPIPGSSTLGGGDLHVTGCPEWLLGLALVFEEGLLLLVVLGDAFGR